MTAKLAELRERTRGDYPAIFPATPQCLNWRFVDSQRRNIGVCRRARWPSRGYVVLRRAEPVESPRGIIVDLYASRFDAQTVDELIRHSHAFFGDPVSAVDCGTSVAEFEAPLRKHGFFRTRAQHRTCISRDRTLRDRIAQLRSDWFLSKGAHDLDEIHAADPNAVGE